MLSASLVSKVGLREAANAPPSAGTLKERAARLGIVAGALSAPTPSSCSSEPGNAAGSWASARPSWLPASPGEAKANWYNGGYAAGAAAPSAERPMLVPMSRRPVKEEVADRPSSGAPSDPLWPASLVAGGVKAEAKSELEQKREEEKERKIAEAEVRDLACKAICAVKHGLRLQRRRRERLEDDDGRPFIPEGWQKTFSPHLGPYVKFLLSRPDQFRVVQGAAPSDFVIENVAGSATVRAPARPPRRRQTKREGERPPEAPPKQWRGGFSSRERLFGAERTEGEVIRWCGGFGWIMPLEPIDHPAAEKHSGDIFVHASDVIGVSKLDAGARVTFVVYVDKSGLGAEECRPVARAGPLRGRKGGKGGKGGVEAKAELWLALAAGVGKGAGKRGKAGRSPPGSPQAHPAQSLRALPPLRLGTPISAASFAGAGGAVATCPKAEEQKEEEEPKEEEVGGEEGAAEEDDTIEALGFVVEGDEEIIDDDDGVEALGFVVEGEDAAVPEAAVAPEPFNIWSLLTAEDDAPDAAARVGVKRHGPEQGPEAAKRARP